MQISILVISLTERNLLILHNFYNLHIFLATCENFHVNSAPHPHITRVINAGQDQTLPDMEKI